MKLLKNPWIIILLLVAILLILFRAKLFGPTYTTKITDDKGEVLSDSIATLEEITLGDMKQSILIRCYDKNNPILLWLHGGPGSSQMPVAHYVDKELEKEFIMVHWDQRGSGKSNTSDFDEETMTYEQFIADAHQLTQYLKERFGKEKIYLLGHSWGTQFGLELVDRYPDDYYSYIGVSQVVDNKLHCDISYPWLMEQINAKDNQKDLEKLKVLGEPPYTDHMEYVNFVQMVDAYGGGFDLPFTRLLWISLQAPEYKLKDYWTYIQGSNRGSGQMWEEQAYSSFNAIECIPALQVPVYFFSGENDYNTPLEAVKAYYEELEAPKGKSLIIFEESSHTPFFAQPQKFNNELMKVKEETYN